MSDTVRTFVRIADGFSARVHGTTDWSAAAPCEGWVARDVVTHVVNAMRRLVGGNDAPEVGADEDVVDAFDSAYAALQTALGQPGILEQIVPGPFGPMPLEQIIGRLMTTDVLIHTWDLARATGQDETLDADAVSHAYSGLLPMDAMIRMPGVFGPKLETAADASEQTRLLRFLGRPA